jgi:hypothetical protein
MSHTTGRSILIWCVPLAVLSVLSASWGPAVALRVRHRTEHVHVGGAQDSSRLMLFVSSGLSWTRVDIDALSEDFDVGDLPFEWSPGSVPGWLAETGWLSPAPGYSSSWVVDSFGIPLRCFVCRWDERLGSARETSPRVGGVAIGRVDHPSECERVLPIRPLWWRLLVNLGFWWLAWVGVLLGAVLAWSHVRLHYGHCPRCGYDLNFRVAAGCSECNWRPRRQHRDSEEL